MTMTTSQKKITAPENSDDVYKNREQDWRNGNIVSQVLVDRFARLGADVLYLIPIHLATTHHK